MQSLYPAKSDYGIEKISTLFADHFSLPAFEFDHKSSHLVTAESHSAAFGFLLVEYFGFITKEQAERIGPPDHWNLSWRATVGSKFNYQVVFIRDDVLLSKQQARKIKQKLRDIFEEVRLHGDSN